MDKKDNQVTNQQQSLIEELTVTDDHAAEVKGSLGPGKTVRFKPGKDLQDLS
jgi:hypothetical protein